MPSRVPRSHSSRGELARQSARVLSNLAGDPDMTGLIKLFVEEIPERVRSIERFWATRDLVQLRRMAHQLKGACGGYGFPQVGDVAGKLEVQLNEVIGAEAEADLVAVQKQVRDLVALCGRVGVS